jgi:DNA-binding transcriptional regulator YhcF (GntR family)
MSELIGKRLKRNSGFYTCSNGIFHIPGLKYYDKLVYNYLCRRADTNGTSFPSRQTIAKDCGLSLSTVKRALDNLEKYMLLAREHQKKGNAFVSNVYVLYEILKNAKNEYVSELVYPNSYPQNIVNNSVDNDVDNKRVGSG